MNITIGCRNHCIARRQLLREVNGTIYLDKFYATLINCCGKPHEITNDPPTKRNKCASAIKLGFNLYHDSFEKKRKRIAIITWYYEVQLASSMAPPYRHVHNSLQHLHTLVFLSIRKNEGCDINPIPLNGLHSQVEVEWSNHVICNYKCTFGCYVLPEQFPIS